LFVIVVVYIGKVISVKSGTIHKIIFIAFQLRKIGF